MPIAPASAAAPAPIFFTQSDLTEQTLDKYIAFSACVAIAYDDVNKCDSHEASAAEPGHYRRQMQLTQHHYQTDARPPGGCSYITMSIDSLENMTLF